MPSKDRFRLNNGQMFENDWKKAIQDNKNQTSEPAKAGRYLTFRCKTLSC